MSYKTPLESLCLFGGGAVLIFGNLLHEPIIILLGTILGIASLIVAILITIDTSGEIKTTEKMFYNSFNYLFSVGIILTIGFPITDITTQRLLYDIALTISTFMILIFIWNILYWKYDFMSVDIADVDIRDEKKKDVLPKFIITSLILGLILGGMNFLLKVIYNAFVDAAVAAGGAANAAQGFKYASYLLLLVVLVEVILILFNQQIWALVQKIQNREKKPKTPKEKKPAAKKPVAKVEKPAAKKPAANKPAPKEEKPSE